MKKIWVLLLAVMLLVGTGVVITAQATDTPQWFIDMIEWRRDQVNEALADNEITQEEAESWLEHIDEMETYHNEEGFTGYGQVEGCPGMFDDDDAAIDGTVSFGRGRMGGFGGCRR